MCTSIISNRRKTIVGWNLDILNMEHRISQSDNGVFIEIKDEKEGWLPLFGATKKGDFVGMPTCWPFDERSNPKSESDNNIILLDIDLLFGKKSFNDIKKIAESECISSVPGVTYMSSLSDINGNVLHIIPGQGYKYYEKPEYAVLTNFSPFKKEKEKHPWMGLDRYNTANEMLKNASYDFDVSDCFSILKNVSQEVCPTVVSMVFDVTEMTVYWCENRNYNTVYKKTLK